MNRSSQISRRSQGLRASRRWNTGRTRAPGFLACAGLPPTTPFRTRDPALEQRTRRQVSRSQVLYPDYTLCLRNGPFPPRFLAPLRHPLQHPSIDAKFWNYLVLGSKNGLGRIGCTRGGRRFTPVIPHLCSVHSGRRTFVRTSPALGATNEAGPRKRSQPMFRDCPTRPEMAGWFAVSFESYRSSANDAWGPLKAFSGRCFPSLCEVSDALVL